MTKKLILLFLFTVSVTLHAQNEASNWHFGNNAGLTFDLINNTVTPIASAISTNEGCSSISAMDGTVLFYTDGRNVWDGNNNIMPNGFGLLGDPSSTSSGLVVPKPNDPSLYYIFTVDEPHHNNAWAYPNQGPADINGNPISFYQEINNNNVPASPNVDDGFNNGLNYSLVDLSLNGGLGDIVVTEKNVQLITYDEDPNGEEIKYKCSEKITAVAADDCSSIWVITQFKNKFYSFKVDDSGVVIMPEVSEILGDVAITTDGYRRNAIGYIKASPDGSKIAVCHNRNSTVPGNENETGSPSGSFWLYDFDNATGLVSNPIMLLDNTAAYGTEFSSDSKKVYLSANGSVTQFDLDNGNQIRQIFNTNGNGFLGAMQLAPNGKIYVTNTSNDNFLDVIENPKEPGNQIIYNQGGQPLLPGTDANLGLPPFISSFFVEKIDIIQDGTSTSSLSLCTDDTYTLEADNIPSATYSWTLDGNPIDDGNAIPYDLEITPNQGGLYELVIQQNNGDCNTFEGIASVIFYEIPVANNLTNVELCGDNNDDVASFNFTSKDSEALLLQDSNQFLVQYFETEDDANMNASAITFPYQNISNPQNIYVRVENADNANCYDINSFELELFNTPLIADLLDQVVCDTENDLTDGIITIDLSTNNSDILGANQDASEFSISYHSSQEDADNKMDELPANYTNTDAFTEEIFVRIENNANTLCFSIDSFILTVNPSPIANNALIFQCDEDGVPDGLTIFNINEITDDITDGIADRTVNYYLNLIGAETENNPIDGSNFNNTTNPQTVVARVTNTITGCVNFSEVILDVSATSANDTTLITCDDDGTEDGLFNFNLADADADVLAGLPTGLDLVYYMTYEEALLEINPLGTTYTNTIAYNETIFVRVENENSCFGINEIKLEVLRLPNIETEFETIYCLNTFPEKITLTGGVINDIPNNFFYNWSTGETTTEIQINEPGTYTVRVTNVIGCFKDRTIIVEASNIATITNIEVIDASQNNSVTVLVTGEGDYEYALDNPNGPYQDSNTFENVRPGLYTVYVRDKNNCGITEDMVSVIGFPKYFTPNGDNNHDFWQVQGISSQFESDTIIYVFDRYGKLLAELNPLGSGWDGTFNGNLMPSSDYWFSVTLEDGRQFSSHFTLKR